MTRLALLFLLPVMAMPVEALAQDAAPQGPVLEAPPAETQPAPREPIKKCDPYPSCLFLRPGAAAPNFVPINPGLPGGLNAARKSDLHDFDKGVAAQQDLKGLQLPKTF